MSCILQSLFLLTFVAGPFIDEYHALSDVNPIMTPVIVTIFLVITALIMMNVFVAILMDAYAEVKPSEKMQYTLAEEAREGFERRISRLTGKAKHRSELEELVKVIEVSLRNTAEHCMSVMQPQS